MAETKVDASGGLDKIVVNMLDDIASENADALRQNCKEAGQRAARLLRQKSRMRSGAYRKGWTCTVETTSDGEATATVHNKTCYQLTHLLEKGHAISNQTRRRFGKAAGDGVIASVYETCADEFAQMGGNGK